MIDKERILDEIIEFTRAPSMRSDEFTVVQFVDRYQELRGPLSIDRGRKMLNRQVVAGMLERRKMLVDGFQRNVYRLKDKEA